MSDDDTMDGGSSEPPTPQWRRRGGVTGMVLAELRELAGSLGVDTTGLRRGDLIAEIKKRQNRPAPGTRRVMFNTPIESLTRVDTVVDDEGRVEERITTITNDYATSTDDVDVQVIEIEPVDLTGDGGGPVGEGPRTAGPPPPARLLSLASLLLAPGERDSWLGELRTARWELRADPRARRRETWGYFQALGTSFVTSWRYRGDGPTQEAS